MSFGGMLRAIPLVGLLAIVAACAVIAVLGYRGELPTNFLEDQQSLISFLAAIIGAFSAVIALIQTLADRRPSENVHPGKRVRFFDDPSQFINRLDEIQKLIATIETCAIVCVHGQKGVGKSEFLKFGSDLFQNPRRVRNQFKPGLSIKVRRRKVIYIDLFDSSSIDQVIGQISRAASGQPAQSVSQLMAKIDAEYGRTPLVIILDNLNNLASVQSVVNMALAHRERRTQDVFVLGSIRRIRDPRTQVGTVELLPFNSVHTNELLTAKNLQLSEDELQGVMNRTGGLPLYIGLVANYYGTELGHQGDFSDYFLTEIYNKLDAEHQELLLFVCICNLSVTTISMDDMAAAGTAYLDAKLRTLHRLSAIIWTTSETGVRIKAHDLIRDIVLRHERARIPSVSVQVRDYFLSTNVAASVLPSLLVEAENASPERTIEQVHAHIDQRDYPVMINLWDNLTEKAQPSSFFATATEIRELLLLGYLQALLGIGSYHQARSVTQSALFRQILSSRPGKIETKLDYELQIALSDLDHLLNNYELARSTIEFIIGECERLSWHAELAQSRWHWAHLTGHIGDDLGAAKKQYEKCQKEAVGLGDNLLEARAFNGHTAIEFTARGPDVVQETQIRRRIAAIADIPGNGPTLSSLYRNLARFNRLNGEFSAAAEHTEQSAEVARKTGLRTLINCDFARGENARLSGNYGDAIPHYQRVIEATLENGDDNLLTSAMTASTICDLYAETGPSFVACLSDLEETIVHVETTAEKFGMLITAARINLVRTVWAARLANTDPDFSSVEEELSRLQLTRDLRLVRSESEIRSLEIHVH